MSKRIAAITPKPILRSQVAKFMTKRPRDSHKGMFGTVAVIGGKAGQLGLGAPVSPCGRCRQMLSELAQLGGTDPVVWCVGEHEVLELPLSALLPHAFGPDALA